MEARVISLPAFQVVGYQIEATVETFESGHGKRVYQELVGRKDEIHNRKNHNVILMQIYPLHCEFNPKVDDFVHLLCYEVHSADDIPVGMMSHAVSANPYVTYTHKGPESELSLAYDYLYGQWMSESGNEPKDYDFEIWDERYQPDSPDNEITLFVALK
ncbi:GyrI-like domain-containing protein [Paenibacillus sp. ACRRY]|uniref:GyrI-like domain-containing protein n=1 Tax=Paenibacillus sp. ACRRY TaxID=2918208 RepID=UPI001EF5498E|nr:GyrI-like domain-containing protein [Paenibacillus sp. ACRRY]MCG7382403.1 GyrI-like domain-containing protein [Paenibacillus sp. ACRRY]